MDSMDYKGSKVPVLEGKVELVAQPIIGGGCEKITTICTGEWEEDCVSCLFSIETNKERGLPEKRAKWYKGKSKSRQHYREAGWK